jgi:hypothetical protein
MKLEHKRLIGIGHLEGKRPSLEDEIYSHRTDIANQRAIGDTLTGVILIRSGTGSEVKTYDYFLGYNPEHPRVKWFRAKWGYNYVK